MTSVPEIAGSREIRLLIVDDDSEIRAELGAYLSAHFFWVQTAANGEEAERHLAAGENADRTGRLLPGLRLADDGGGAQPGAGGALCLRLPLRR